MDPQGGYYQINPARHVLWIGCDGVRPDTLEVSQTPHLDALREAGALYTTGYAGGFLSEKPDDYDEKGSYNPEDSEDTRLNSIWNPYDIHNRDESFQSTSSYPGWSSMVTGVWANKHGVYHQYDEGDPNMIRYPHFFRLIKGYSQNSFLATIMSWTPFHVRVPSHFDYRYNTLRVDGAISGAVKSILEKDDLIPTVIFCGYDRSDWWGHDGGFSPGSSDSPNEKILDYVALEDEWIGEMIQAIKDRPDYANEEWLVIMTADHGGYDRDECEDKGYLNWFWNENKGDHGNWGTNGPLVDDESDVENPRTAEDKLALAKEMADQSRLIPMLLWCNKWTESVDTRYAGGITEQKSQQSESRWAITPTTDERHPIVDLVPTVLDFLDIPVDDGWGLEGTSLLRDYPQWAISNDESDVSKKADEWPEGSVTQVYQ